MNKAIIFNEKIENIPIENFKKKFNIFFFDPPFSDNYYTENLRMLKKNNLFQEDNIVIIHRERKSEDDLQDHINLIETKQYGRSKIIFGSFQ